MDAEEFYKKENPNNNLDYDSRVDDWRFDKTEMITFAERYHETKMNNWKTVENNFDLIEDIIWGIIISIPTIISIILWIFFTVWWWWLPVAISLGGMIVLYAQCKLAEFISWKIERRFYLYKN